MSNLVLTRKKHDSVIIYDKDKELCRITVTACGTKQVKLAFQADNDVKIDREEIYIQKTT
jgi:carbon storage regulator CsrA